MAVLGTKNKLVFSNTEFIPLLNIITHASHLLLWVFLKVCFKLRSKVNKGYLCIFSNFALSMEWNNRLTSTHIKILLLKYTIRYRHKIYEYLHF